MSIGPSDTNIKSDATTGVIKVGVTGNIGSGKTRVCKIFETLGIPIYYADDRAKYLMNSDPSLNKRIKYLFGPEVYIDNKINRPYLSSIVFNDKEKLIQLNKTVHPAIARDSERWFESQTAPYAIKEAALLVETGSHQKLDVLIVVTAPKELRINRVMARDQVSRDQVEARINNQLSEDVLVKLSDYIIVNNGKQMLIPQIHRIHKILSANLF